MTMHLVKRKQWRNHKNLYNLPIYGARDFTSDEEREHEREGDLKKIEH
jgi:hypothetical protein